MLSKITLCTSYFVSRLSRYASRFRRQALGIDISKTLINLALLKKNKNGVELLKTASGAVPDGAIKDGNIEGPLALAKAIKELKTGSKIRANHAAMSLIAEPMLMQILDLPKNVPGNIRQFVQDEVKHYAKLPIKKVAIDFCGIKCTARSGYARALVVATDSQKITEAAKALNREGLNIDAIEPASVAYIRACYAKKIAERFDRNLLFAIVYENILTLCVFRNQTLDFVRTKRLEADVCEPDKCCEWLAEEINAVLRFYELEVPDNRQGWEVTLVESICNKSIKDKLEGVELEVRTLENAYLDTPAADTECDDRPSAIAVGLAMKVLNFPAGGLNINLLPPEVVEIKSVRKQTLVSAIIAAAILFLMILSIGFLNIKVKKINENIERTKLAQNTRALLNEQALLNRQIANISKKLNSMNTVLGTSPFLKWGQILNDIRLVIPKTVRITKLFSGDNSSKMLLEGQGSSYEDIQHYVDTLNACEHIESASLVGTEKDSKSDKLVSYSISCSLVQ